MFFAVKDLSHGIIGTAADGTIEVYFDDLKSPAMTATDKTFAWGRLGIGSFDQFTQQYSPTVAGALANVPFVGGALQNLAQDSAVFGKILVLCVIILFLQWRPSGLFAARSRSLD